MVEISLSGSGEGPQAETPGAYSTRPGNPQTEPARATERGGSWPGAALSGGTRERAGKTRHRGPRQSVRRKQRTTSGRSGSLDVPREGTCPLRGVALVDLHGGADSEALARCPVMALVELDAEIGASRVRRCDQRGAGAAEGIEHQAAGLAERLDDRRQALHRLLRRVQPVARVLPVQHVRQPSGGRLRVALASK